jgi:hypothetical protein
MKHTWLVGAFVGVMLAGSAAAQTQPQMSFQSKPAAQGGAVPTGETSLGTVNIPRAVLADGKPLPAGTYTLRLTAQTAQPEVPGQQPDLSRWVEFVRGGKVYGREIVSIIPADEVGQTQPGPDLEAGRARVPRGSTRVETLKGGEFIRVWVNRAGNNYLLHLPPATGAAAK